MFDYQQRLDACRSSSTATKDSWTDVRVRADLHVALCKKLEELSQLQAEQEEKLQGQRCSEEFADEHMVSSWPKLPGAWGGMQVLDT